MVVESAYNQLSNITASHDEQWGKCKTCEGLLLHGKHRIEKYLKAYPHDAPLKLLRIIMCIDRVLCVLQKQGYKVAPVRILQWFTYGVVRLITPCGGLSVNSEKLILDIFQAFNDLRISGDLKELN